MAARLTRALAGATLALAWASGAWADEYAERRASCEPVMTVVREDCSVENIRICPNGDRWSESFDIDGTSSFETTDSEYGLVSSFDSESGEGWSRVLRTDRAFSLSEMLRLGRSSGSYVVELKLIFPFPRPSVATMDVRLTGETRTLNHVTFDIGAAEMGLAVGTGSMMAVAAGPVLIDRERGLVLTDTATVTFNGGSTDVGDAILDVILPGQPKFMADAPLPDCRRLSLATPLPEPPHG